ncbi:uncharacterized protein LOC114933994 [Nylanderia fulva]|uniref:uncharacterized protein LOC114933994 n=1 Tax=Nylanderia fulva TaxID=613905 RepID=UPI0010FAD72C|nr:uncharacterized protein LOC114933994 [Nylanderia fulva]
MFESDDWTFEDVFDDIDEKTIQFHSRCLSEQESSSVKRRKVDNSKILFSSMDNTFNSDGNIATENSTLSRNNESDTSRNLLLGIFQENASQERFNLAKEISKPLNDIQREAQCFQLCKTNTLHYKKSKEKNYIKTVNKVKLDKEVKLVRIFPGPAGLISDVKNDNISVVSYLDRVKELEKTAIKHIEIKSQNEKNLVGEKAWKFLLDDVSDHFLEEYRISMIKKKANTNHCNSMKVKFIAGVLDCIDHSQDDPYIILKDSTGCIEGTIHRDILLKYPGILEPNVVIFLHNVGLLKTTTYILTNKYHILISQVNLLAIYSDKGRIVSTPHMENILSNIELNKDYHSMPGTYENCDKVTLQINFSVDNKSIKDCEPVSIKDPILYQASRKYPSYKQDYENCKDKIFSSPNYSISMNNNLDMNNIFSTTDCEFLISKKQNCLSSQSTLCNKKIQQYELPSRNINYLENTRKESIINSQNKMGEEKYLSQSLQKCVADVKISNAQDSRESCLYDNISHESHTNSNLNVKSTLPEIKSNLDNLNTLVSYFSNVNEYDSDDEILSQLDADNVFNAAMSKKKC